VREKIGAFGKISKIVFVQKLPKTRSGKILRNLLRDITNNVEVPKVAATIEDYSVVPDLIQAYKAGL
jgi:acyl-coenzyme A synthetase/AMP-(fatty) acid ligase